MNNENCLNDSISKHNQNDNFQTFLIDYAIGVLRKKKNKTKQIEQINKTKGYHIIIFFLYSFYHFQQKFEINPE